MGPFNSLHSLYFLQTQVSHNLIYFRSRINSTCCSINGCEGTEQSIWSQAFFKHHFLDCIFTRSSNRNGISEGKTIRYNMMDLIGCGNFPPHASIELPYQANFHIWCVHRAAHDEFFYRHQVVYERTTKMVSQWCDSVPAFTVAQYMVIWKFNMYRKWPMH